MGRGDLTSWIIWGNSDKEAGKNKQIKNINYFFYDLMVHINGKRNLKKVANLFSTVMIFAAVHRAGYFSALLECSESFLKLALHFMPPPWK